MASQFSTQVRGSVVLAAGGTGGHLFPAQALGEELVRRGYLIHLITDARAQDYGGKFPAIAVHQISSSTLTLSKPWRLPLQAFKLLKGYRQSKAILSDLRNKGLVAVVGFGGYPSFPPLVAASRLGVPTCIHEQNAVMGRANRAIAGKVNAIASSFPDIANLPANMKDRVTFCGNPVRDVVLQQAGIAYEPAAAERVFRLLVFGGSQGARFFSKFMPEFARALPNAVRKRLRIVQQCRPEDLDEVQNAYDAIGLKVQLAPFFPDLPKRIAQSHLVFCRSGASTIAELSVIGRPSLLVPLPHALDNDQLLNARSLSDAGGGWLFRQNEMTAENLAAFFTRLRYRPGELAEAAVAAKRFGRPDAASRLADLVETLAGQRSQPAASGKGLEHETST